LSLPMYAELTTESQTQVVNAVIAEHDWHFFL
jgi:hypothetical protein